MLQNGIAFWAMKNRIESPENLAVDQQSNSPNGDLH